MLFLGPPSSAAPRCCRRSGTGQMTGSARPSSVCAAPMETHSRHSSSMTGCDFRQGWAVLACPQRCSPTLQPCGLHYLEISAAELSRHASAFVLAPHYTSSAASASALCSISWFRLQRLTSAHVRRYGRTRPKQAATLTAACARCTLRSAPRLASRSAPWRCTGRWLVQIQAHA